MRAELIANNKALVVTLTNRGDHSTMKPSGTMLNNTFELSPAELLVLTREEGDVKLRIDQAVSVITRSESIRSAYHHGIFVITKEAWRILGKFRPDADAELAFVEILEANRRLRVCDQSVQGALRDLRQRLELHVTRESQPSESSSQLEARPNDTSAHTESTKGLR